MTGVIAYLCEAKKDWIKKLLLVSLFIAMVPGLNSLFILLNNSYYARWFYMPILIMCVATAIAFERVATANLMRGVHWSFGIVAIYTIAIGVTPRKVDDQWKIGLYEYADRFWAYVLIALACVPLPPLLFSICATARSLSAR